ncbi:MAG: hypothetical protein FWE41_00540 [Coriobacteriia bacterium]|nr:hypothetical protein [Coriobacteriia bacterium]MCL2749951.1 hypothetical protein [Coriobacteriia bacterium]
MKILGKRLAVLLVALSMAATLGLAGCNGDGSDQSDGGSSMSDMMSQLVEGDVTGQVGKEYATKWFTFTINSMSTGSSFAGFEAASGSQLLITNITITNTYGTPQPFGTFDWFVQGEGTSQFMPMSPLNNGMMPDSFELGSNETVTYDVVVEFPIDIKSPYFMYVEIDEQGSIYTTFKLPIK